MVKTFIQFIVYSNLFVSICAAALTHISFLIFSIPLKGNWPILVLVFSSTYFTYNLQRIAKLKLYEVRKENINDRLAWILNRKKILLYSSMLVALGVFISLFFLNTNDFILLAFLGALSFCYVCPVVPMGGKFVALRDLPWLKIFVVSTVWSTVTVVLPYHHFYEPGVFPPAKWMLQTLAMFLFIFAITLPFDVRDMKYDKEQGLQTIPLLFGVRKTIALSLILLFLYIVIQFLQYHYFRFFYGTQFFAFVLPAFVAMIIIPFTKTERNELFFSGVIEGTMLLLYFGVLLTNP